MKNIKFEASHLTSGGEKMDQLFERTRFNVNRMLQVYDDECIAAEVRMTANSDDKCLKVIIDVVSENENFKGKLNEQLDKFRGTIN